MRDLTNQRFGRQVAIKPCGTNKYGNILWLCKCDCGKEHIVPSGKLVQGKSKSCGCLAKDVHIAQLQTHGITTGGKPRTFIIWNDMKARCLNPKSISYKNYGARGITVCQEWLTYENFHNWALNNGYNDQLTLDRIDNEGNYCPENCRWVTMEYNRAHQRRTKFFVIDGEELSFTKWCEKAGISRYIAHKILDKSEETFVKTLKERIALSNGKEE